MNHNTKQSFLNAAVQAGAARQFALMKAGTHFKDGRSEKVPYAPTRIQATAEIKMKLDLSSVSYSIKKFFGDIIIDRRQRRELAKSVGLEQKRFYSGDEPVRVPHNIRPSKYAGRK